MSERTVNMVRSRIRVLPAIASELSPSSSSIVLHSDRIDSIKLTVQPMPCAVILTNVAPIAAGKRLSHLPSINT